MVLKYLSSVYNMAGEQGGDRSKDLDPSEDALDYSW